ncbi:MAG: hypothetical protein ACI9UA_003627 [Pseudoalteromonas tetraodonis]
MCVWGSAPIPHHFEQSCYLIWEWVSLLELMPMPILWQKAETMGNRSTLKSSQFSASWYSAVLGVALALVVGDGISGIVRPPLE